MKTPRTYRRLRLIAAATATVVAGAALATAAFAGLRSLDLGPAAASQYPKKKVAVCHRTHSKKHPWVKIRISQRALKAHLRHGDFVIDANHPCPPTNSKHKQHGKGKHKHHGKGKHKGEGANKGKHDDKGKSGKDTGHKK